MHGLGVHVARYADEMLTAAELAAELKVSRRTLARWRTEGTGPPFVRVQRSPRYRWGDVQAWLRRTGETSPGPPEAR